MNNDTVTMDKLITDLKVVIRDAEELLKATAGEVGEKAREARTRLTATLETARATCLRLEEKVAAGAKATDQLIRDHPYQSLGIAAGVGLLIGLLITRK